MAECGGKQGFGVMRLSEKFPIRLENGGRDGMNL
jgi:hypothetical protein